MEIWRKKKRSNKFLRIINTHIMSIVGKSKIKFQTARMSIPFLKQVKPIRIGKTKMKMKKETMLSKSMKMGADSKGIRRTESVMGKESSTIKKGVSTMDNGRIIICMGMENCIMRMGK